MPLSECKVGSAAAVSDMARAKEFYEGVLKLEPQETMGDQMVTYSCGGGTGLAVYVSEYAGTNKATLAGFEVSDFDALYTELKKAGVEFEVYEDESGATTDESGIIEAGEYRVAFFKDPDGNTFSLNG